MLNRVVLLIIAVSMIMVVSSAIPVKADSTSLENKENFSITTSTYDESLLVGSVTGYTLSAGDVLFISWKGNPSPFLSAPRVYLLTDYQFHGWDYFRKCFFMDPASRGWIMRNSSWEMTLNYSITSSDTYYVIIDNPNWIPDILPPSIDIISYEAIQNYPNSYYLSIRTDPAGIVSIPGEDWYLRNHDKILTALPTVTVSPSMQYRFEYWDVDGVSYGIGVNPITVTMNENHTATAHYVLQYQATFSQTGLDSSAVTTVVSINGVPKMYSDLPYVFWIDSDRVIVFSYNTTVSSSTPGKSFVLKNVTGSTSPIMVTSPLTVTGNYMTRYYLTVSSTHGTTGGEGWYDAGDTAYATVTPLTVLGPTGVRYVFTHWSEDASGNTSPSNPITMDGPKTTVANWKIQYKLIVKTSPAGLSPSPTPPTDWYDESTDVILTAQTVSGYTFNYWDVDGGSKGSGVNPITVHIDNPHTATAHYQTAAPPPPPVGGKAIPIIKAIDKPELPIPWIWLTTIILPLIATVVFVKLKKKQ